MYNKTELIFIGKVFKIDTIKTVPDYFVRQFKYTEDSTNTYTNHQLISFAVKKLIKGSFSIDTLVIMTGMGGGDCGYFFENKKTYIVHSNEIASYYIDETSSKKKLLKKHFLETNVCTRTTSEIKKELKFLRKFQSRSYRQTAHNIA